MPWYRRHGKIQIPLSEEEWLDAMKYGRFVKREHKGFLAMLYYFAVRKTEALKTKRNQIQLHNGKLIYDVRERLKGSKTTPPLPIPLDLPYVDEIVWCWEKTKQNERIWKFSPKTAYNIVERVFPGYPHYFRLSRITNFFKDGWTIVQVRSWTGLSLNALEFYVGLVDIEKMGEKLR